MKTNSTKIFLPFTFLFISFFAFALNKNIYKNKKKSPCVPTASTFTTSACDSFFWMEKNKWYTANNNTDTIILVNADGCDSVITIDVTINNTVKNTIVQAACDSFIWNGNHYHTTGMYNDTLMAASGCDSIVTLDLTINHPTYSFDTVKACLFYTWNSNLLSASGTYLDTIPNAAGCDSFMSLVLTINSPGFSTTTLTTCDSLQWNGATYNTSGTYVTKIPTVGGCDSFMTLHLTINNSNASTFTTSSCDSFYWAAKMKTYYASNTTDTIKLMNAAGCDSIITLNLTINNSTASTFTASVCGSYTWALKNKTYTASNNTDTVMLMNAAGCDSIITLNLTINNSSTSSQNITACDSYTWNGNTYSASGTYLDTIPNANGCDSFMTLNLTINNSSSSSQNITACYSYTWNGNTYSASGTYLDTIPNASGCDSFMTLNLVINNASSSSFTATSCDSFYWAAKMKTYYTSNTTDTIKLMNAVGCDSILTLNLTINNSTASTFTVSACGNYTWALKNITYTASNNTDTVMLMNAAGCDSIITLNLTINTSSTSTQNITTCDSYTWNGNNYSTSGTYLDTIPNASGCDSFMTLNLVINNASSSSFTATSCDSFYWPAKMKTYYASNNTDTIKLKNAAGCDSIITLNLTINHSTTSTFTASACGSYTWALKNKTYTANNNTDTVKLINAAGCDSIVTLNLTILTNITGVHINGIGAFCGDTAITQLSTNINYTYGSVSYQWSRKTFIDELWQIVGSDSILNVSTTYPAQYVLRTTIAGCGTFWSNQEAVVPINKPTLSLNPSPTVSICNNTDVTLNASSTDGGVNTFTFSKGSTVLKSGADTSYTTPILTTANTGSTYTVELSNTKPLFDGNITENFWGKPFAVSVWGPSSSFGAGHELNAVYARADSNNLYFAIAGNVKNNNRILMFIDSKTGGYNNTNYGRTGIGNQAIKNLNSGIIFDPGFDADYCVGIGTDNTNSQFYFDLYEMTGTASGGGGSNNYIGSNTTPKAGYNIGANPANATQTQGFEFSIPKSAVGYSNGNIRIFLMYSSDGGFLSNQFLTKANISSGNFGNGAVNFSFASPDPIVIPVHKMLSTCKTSLSTTVTVKPNLTSVLFDTVCNNALPYTWSGMNISVAGTYNDTALGSNGCDSFATLHLTIKDTSTSTTNYKVCNNQLPYVWNGTNYSAAGTYIWKGKNAVGCDSVATLILTIADTTTSTTNQTICNNQLPYSWNGNSYYTAGTYTWKGMNMAGCDSFATLVLMVNDTTTSLQQDTACKSYTWNGTTYTTSGTYIWLGKNGANCDSLATLQLIIKDTSASSTNVTICKSQTPYSWNGTNYTATGMYKWTGTNAVGCDSVATLNLTVNDTTKSITNKTVCSNQLPFTWNGNSYSTAGTYTWSGTNSVSCDSLATLNLTISDTTTSTTTTSACDSLWWNGIKYTSTGTYTWKGLNAAGCDSAATLNLTINASPAAPSITTLTANVVAPATGIAYGCTTVSGAASYTWSYTGTGATIVTGQGTENITVDFISTATNGDMQVVAVGSNGCASAASSATIALPIIVKSFNVVKANNNANLTWTSSSEINSKEYQVERSVDGRNFESIGTVAAKGVASEYNFVDNKLPTTIDKLTIYYRLRLIDKDGKFSYSSTKQLEIKNTKLEIVLYPNPAKDVLNINSVNANTIRIIDNNGRLVYINNKLNNTGVNTISISNLAKGTYYLEVISTDGLKQMEKFIKE